MLNADLEGKYNTIYSKGKEDFFTQMPDGKYDSKDESYLISKFITDWNGKRVLEIGCGTGFLANYLSTIGADVTACDYSEEAIRIARNRYGNARFIHTDYKEIDGKYDVVIMQGVLEHLNNPFGELKYIMDTRATDCLITTSPGFCNPRGYVWMALYSLFDIPMSLTDLYFLNPFDFEEFCEQCGYKLQIRSTDEDWASGDRMIVDYKKRLRNALSDAGFDSGGVGKFLKWAERANKTFEHNNKTGATVGYKITRG